MNKNALLISNSKKDENKFINLNINNIYKYNSKKIKEKLKLMFNEEYISSLKNKSNELEKIYDKYNLDGYLQSFSNNLGELSNPYWLVHFIELFKKENNNKFYKYDIIIIDYEAVNIFYDDDIPNHIDDYVNNIIKITKSLLNYNGLLYIPKYCDNNIKTEALDGYTLTNNLIFNNQYSNTYDQIFYCYKYIKINNNMLSKILILNEYNDIHNYTKLINNITYDDIYVHNDENISLQNSIKKLYMDNQQNIDSRLDEINQCYDNFDKFEYLSNIYSDNLMLNGTCDYVNKYWALYFSELLRKKNNNIIHKYDSIIMDINIIYNIVQNESNKDYIVFNHIMTIAKLLLNNNGYIYTPTEYNFGKKIFSKKSIQLLKNNNLNIIDKIKSHAHDLSIEIYYKFQYTI